jgi:hypothetical protein
MWQPTSSVARCTRSGIPTSSTASATGRRSARYGCRVPPHDAVAGGEGGRAVSILAAWAGHHSGAFTMSQYVHANADDLAAGPDHLDANYRRAPGRGRTVQPSAYVDACPWQPQRACVAVPRCCTGRLARASTLPGARPQHAFKSARLGPAQVMESVAWTACPPNLASGSGRPACQPGRWRCMSYLEKRDCPCCNE